jgi:zinc transport system substrate-binding protein
MILRIVLVIALATCAAGCGDGGNGKTTVAAGFYPLAWAAERIGGRNVDVQNLTPPGSEPHDLELTPREVADIQRADLVLYLGHGFQPAVTAAAENAEGRRIDLLSGLPLHGDDPHVWLDPNLFMRIAKRVGGVLDRSASPLSKNLRQLDSDFRTGLRDCRRREIVTSHEAFGYLAARYGLKEVAITGIEPESEPSPKQLADVVRVVRRTGATTVFFETLVSPRLAETVAREVGARTAVLNPLEGLTTEQQREGDDYLSLMRGNLMTLREALGCR